MCPAQGSLRKKTRFGWLVSEETELLEAEGATARGIAILDELKAVYSRTGAERPIRNRVVSASRELFSNGQSEIRIIEIGARDGTLLRQIGEDLADAGIHSELHGVEFRENIVELARQRGAAAAGILRHSLQRIHASPPVAFRDHPRARPMPRIVAQVRLSSGSRSLAVRCYRHLAGLHGARKQTQPPRFCTFLPARVSSERNAGGLGADGTGSRHDHILCAAVSMAHGNHVG